MNEEYLKEMKEYVDIYNNFPDDEIEGKNICLMLLLSKMYENKFKKKLNMGILLTTVFNPSHPWSLAEILSNNFLRTNSRNLLLTFNPDKNELRFGDLMAIGELDHIGFSNQMSTCFKGPSFNDECIIFDIVNDTYRLKYEFVLTNQNDSLIIDHSNNFLSDEKIVYCDPLYVSPIRSKAYEKREYDNDGIEIKRQVYNKINVGASGSQNLGVVYSKEHMPFDFAEYKTIITRDPNFFMLAKIDNYRNDRLIRDFKMNINIHGEQYELETDSTVGYSNTLYSACTNGYSLEVFGHFFGEPEKDKAILYCFNSSLQRDELKNLKVVPQIFDEKLEIIPGINDVIRNRAAEAKIYCKNYLDSHKK